MGGTSGNEMDRLKEIIQVIDRPLAFAERGGAVALKDLGRFISRQVTDALAEHVRPSAIEAELLRLAQLFTDYEQLPPGMRAARVSEARAVIVRLDQTVDAPPPTSGRPANRLSEYPVQYIRGVRRRPKPWAELESGQWRTPSGCFHGGMRTALSAGPSAAWFRGKPP